MARDRRTSELIRLVSVLGLVVVAGMLGAAVLGFRLTSPSDVLHHSALRDAEHR